MSLIGIWSLIFAVQEGDLFNQNDLQAITLYNQDDCVREFQYFLSACQLDAFGSSSGTVYDNIKLYFFVNCP